MSVLFQLSQREIYGRPTIKIHPELINSRRRALNSHQSSTSDFSHDHDDAKMFLRAWVAVNNIECELSCASSFYSRSLYEALNYLAKRIADNAGNTNNPDYERNFLIYFQHLHSLGLLHLISSVLCSGPLYISSHLTNKECRQYILNKIMSITTLRKIVGKEVWNFGESVGEIFSYDDHLLDYLFHCCAVPGLTLPSADLFEDLYILRQDCFVLPDVDELNKIVSCLGSLQLAIFTRILGISIRDLDKYQIRISDQSGERFKTIEIQKKNLERIIQVPGLIRKLLGSLKTLCIQATPRYHNSFDENRTWHRYLDDLLSTQLQNGYNPGPAGQMSEDLLTYTALIDIPNFGDEDVPENLAYQSTLNSIVVLNSNLSLVNFLYLLVSGPRRKSVVKMLICAGLFDKVLKSIFDRLMATNQQSSSMSENPYQMSSPEAVLKVHLFRLLQLVLHVVGTDSTALPHLVKSSYSSDELDMLFDITSRLLVEDEKDSTIEDIRNHYSDQPRTCYRKGFLKTLIEYFSNVSLPRWQKFWLCAILETYLRISPKPAAYQIFFSRYDAIKSTIKCFLSACGSDLFSPISAPNRTLTNASRESELILNMEVPVVNERVATTEYASKPSLHETSLDLLAGLMKFNHRNIMRLAKDLPTLLAAPPGCSKNCSSNPGVPSIHSAGLCETKWPSRVCTCLGSSCTLQVPSGTLFCFLRHICDNVIASSLLLRTLVVTQHSLPWHSTVPANDGDFFRNTALFMEAFSNHCLKSYICYKLLRVLDPQHLAQSEISALTTALTILVLSCKTDTLNQYINSFREYIRRDSNNPAVNLSESSFMKRLNDLCNHWSQRFLNSSRIDFSSLYSSTRLQVEDFIDMLRQVLNHPILIKFQQTNHPTPSNANSQEGSLSAEGPSSSSVPIIPNRLSTSSQESHRSNATMDEVDDQSNVEMSDAEEEDFGSSERTSY